MMNTGETPTTEEILQRSKKFMEMSENMNLDFMRSASLYGIRIEPSDRLDSAEMVLLVSRRSFERLLRSARTVG